MQQLSVADVLDRAAVACAKPGAWCQGASARDQFGRDVRESKCVPVSHWMLGHISQSVTPEQWGTLFALIKRVTSQAPTAWNDAPERTQSEVVAALRAAAELAKASS